MRLYYFFSKKECILAILEGLIFKIFRPVGPNHGGADLVTEPQPPQSQNCGYGPELILIFLRNLLFNSFAKMKNEKQTAFRFLFFFYENEK